MRIAVEGCAHGELEIIYDAILESEKKDGNKVDLLLCCGDFQSTRNWRDVECMAVSDKYKDIGTFYKYYTGEKVAPCLTIFIGGNHEASNYLQELAYGGWVAPNIYYLGYAGVVTVAGIRIAGMSGIYKSHDFMKGHYEYPPYVNQSLLRSCYHVRNLEVFRLKQLSGNVDAFMSHDWPTEITDYGNVQALLRRKKFFREDIENKTLGSPHAMQLLKQHYPSYWFSAHLHCKFVAIVPKEDDSTKQTKFLALDKCLPHRKFLQIIEVEHDESLPIKLSYDLEWLTILFLTNHLLSVKSGMCYMPGPNSPGRLVFTPTDDEKEKIHRRFNYDLSVPLNFKESVEPYNPENPKRHGGQPNLAVNDQTTEFCNKLGIDDPFALLKIANNIVDEANRSNEASFSSSRFTESSANLSTEDDEDAPNFVIDTTPSFNPMLSMTPLKLPAAKNDSTSFEESESSSQKEDQSVGSVTPLKLPAAKNDSASFEDSESFLKLDQSICSTSSRKSVGDPEKESSSETKDLSSSSISVTSPLSLPPPKAANGSLDESQSPPDEASQRKSPRRSIDEVEAESTTGEPKPEPKKFKRRNQSIYSNSDT